ncbi:hypothetical protein MIMGU_mgv1a013106mg [Erythranthe guttata]|uniref:Uncharacterized protein n=1 Tax=Erythranthe guttata TaxID=4155 RepID=A0A022R4A4_ERYGU|nr:PREDICTED: myb-like protein D [Erythranthe guttata]EYU34824.1 hypothetical protein MIMGU_mgv1a013106mg [Erythranthe guttata]|eukprot:XP_012840558.1 PREDICTED: myb-like protein D [Erythranthe guttata]
MGCGISRFDSRLHDHDHDRVDGDGREDRSTKNNHGGKGRLLFVKSSTNGGGGDGCRRSVSSHPYNKSLSPINHIASQQHHRCHERPNKRNSGEIENKNILDRENNNLNKYGRDAEKDEEEEEGGGRKCISKDDIDKNNNNNGDEMEGSSIMFRGSPSFREYCRPEDQINTNNNNNTNDKEEEEMMRKKTVVGVRTRRENIKNKGAGSGGVAAAVKRRVRRLRKVSPTTTT